MTFPKIPLVGNRTVTGHVPAPPDPQAPRLAQLASRLPLKVRERRAGDPLHRPPLPRNAVPQSPANPAGPTRTAPSLPHDVLVRVAHATDDVESQKAMRLVAGQWYFAASEAVQRVRITRSNQLDDVLTAYSAGGIRHFDGAGLLNREDLHKLIAALPSLSSLDCGIGTFASRRGPLDTRDMPTLGTLRHLTNLNLARHRIRDDGLRDLWAQKLPLTALNVSCNDITPTGILAIPQNDSLLKSLDVSSNRIGDRGARHLLGLVPGLESLNLSGTGIGPGTYLALRDSEGLRHLALCGNRVNAISLQHLADHPTLGSLDLADNECGDTGIPFISRIRGLTALNLDANNITGYNLGPLFCLRSLRKLSLSGNLIDDTGLPDLANIPGLEELNLRHNLIAGTGLGPLGNHATLERLDLSNNRLRTDCIRPLAASASLVELRLRETGLGDRAAEDLAASAILELLDMRACHVTDKGVEALAKNRSLRELDLSFNHATDKGVVRLARHAGLRILKLDSNERRTGIGDKSAKALGKSRVTHLSLRDNHITDEGVIALLENPHLISLDLRGNPIGPKGRAALEAARGRFQSLMF